MTTTLSNAPPSITPKVASGKALQLADINPVELARQMTLLEFQLYNRIRPVDCLNKAWSRTDRPEAGANIKAMILTSNRVSPHKNLETQLTLPDRGMGRGSDIGAYRCQEASQCHEAFRDDG